ncbi:unnamed protein product [Bemisia tabaci]|uniref:Phosphatidylethanolamine-binding protein n=1 Tax=Bemisia tabaci TaxID=7038 RepID=A0A9P0AH69_BEMTA|nr:unnamed protein product [Bemisia tabaci]
MCFQQSLMLIIYLVQFYMNDVLAYASHYTPEGIEAQLKKYRIVPDIMENATREDMEVEYQGNLMIQMGNFVSLNRTAFEPKIKWKVDPNFYYTVTLLDADYVNIMVLQKVQYQLWMILNIPGDNITAGELLTEYMGPNPEKDNLPYHRFVFVLWQHPFVHFRELRVRGGQLPIYRENFNAKKFTEKYEEDGLGEPYAVNFFRTCHPKEE